ncbi:hypothetical protein ACFQGT_19115 [Natrialbaceae archaeon GCM10025810]|uniref:hypothetical protein n=1 Tax=Halovalidus salilacus TaxID=3075124 RepID=UPI00361C57E2
MNASAVFSRLEALRYAFAGTITFVLVSLSVGGFVPVGGVLAFDPAEGIAISLALLSGPTAALGVAVGVVVTAAVRSALSLWVVFEAATTFFLGYAAYRLWYVLPNVATGERPTLASARQWLEFVTVTVVAAASSTAILAWGAQVAGRTSFHAIAIETGVTRVLSSLVVGAVLVPVFTRRWDVDAHAKPYRYRSPIDGRSGAFFGAVVVPIWWLVAGAALSVASDIGPRIHPASVAGIVGGPLSPETLAAIGVVGRTAQIVFGAALLAIVLRTYASSDPTTNRSVDEVASTADGAGVNQ